MHSALSAARSYLTGRRTPTRPSAPPVPDTQPILLPVLSIDPLTEIEFPLGEHCTSPESVADYIGMDLYLGRGAALAAYRVTDSRVRTAGPSLHHVVLNLEQQ